MADTNTARVQQTLRNLQTCIVTDLLIVIQTNFSQARTHSQELLDGLGRLVTDQVVAEKEAFETWKSVKNLEDVVRASAANAVVLEAQCHKICLVTKRGAELAHSVIVQVIIVQEYLLQTCILDEGTRDGFETRVADQV